MRSKKYCKSYVGVACVNGSCPNALRNEDIEAYKDIPVEHVSYLYYGYRFKAMRAAERGVTLVAKDYMHMALHSMEIPPEYEAGLEKAFSATHDNASWILNEVDRATPNPDTVHWDI